MQHDHERMGCGSSNDNNRQYNFLVLSEVLFQGAEAEPVAEEDPAQKKN